MREGVGGRVSEESSLGLPPELSPVQRVFSGHARRIKSN